MKSIIKKFILLAGIINAITGNQRVVIGESADEFAFSWCEVPSCISFPVEAGAVEISRGDHDEI
jgi:hypothetical protein